MVTMSVLVIVLLIAGLAFYLFVVGGQLKRIATNLEECATLVRTIVGHAQAIEPGVEHAVRLLIDEIDRDMAMLGINTPREISKEFLMPATGAGFLEN